MGPGADPGELFGESLRSDRSGNGSFGEAKTRRRVGLDRYSLPVPSIELFGETRSIDKTSLSQNEVAFVLQTTVREVRNRLRRGRYMLENDADPDEAVEAGALVPVGPSTRSRVAVDVVLAVIGGYRLAAEATVAISTGRYVVRPPASIDDRPEDLRVALFLLG